MLLTVQFVLTDTHDTHVRARAQVGQFSGTTADLAVSRVDAVQAGVETVVASTSQAKADLVAHVEAEELRQQVQRTNTHTVYTHACVNANERA